MYGSFSVKGGLVPFLPRKEFFRKKRSFRVCRHPFYPKNLFSLLSERIQTREKTDEKNFGGKTPKEGNFKTEKNVSGFTFGFGLQAKRGKRSVLL